MLTILILGIKWYFSNESPNGLHSQEKLAGDSPLPPIILRTFSNQLTDSAVIKEHCLPLAVTDLHDFSKTHEHVPSMGDSIPLVQ